MNPAPSIRNEIALFCALLSTAFALRAESPHPDPAVGSAVQETPDTQSAVTDRLILDTAIDAALKKLNPNLNPDYIGPSPVPGYREVIIRGQVVFVTDDGHYLVQGLTDIRDGRNMAQFGAMPGRRLKALAEVPVSERIVFAPDGPPKYTVTVFTDVECGFCRKFHQDIAEYNRLGISVEYLAFPRAGMGSPDAAKMESVWCSADRRKALTAAKNGVEIPALKCENTVARQRDVGERIGLQGTPMIINADGVALPGYLPPAKLLEALDELADKHRRKGETGSASAQGK